MLSVYLLTIRQLTGKWRLVIMSVLALMPIGMAVMAIWTSPSPSVEEFEIIVFSNMLAGSIAPLVVLAIASVAFANELEDRTLANLTLSPLPRWQIVVPKLLAAVSVAGPFMVASAFVTTHLAFQSDATATFAVTVSALVGVLMYSSVFIWLGLVTTRAIGFGLLYIILWEGFFGGFVSGVKYLSIRHYSLGLMHGLDERRFAEANNLSFEAAIITSVIVVFGFLLLSIRRMRRMDVP